ncbi:MAG TPA: hypothetical protein VK961_21870 [Chthoniobacter sp.]|nr:hypothetical protein [Chthoniobacter sp.]
MSREDVVRFVETELPSLSRDDHHGEAGYALPPASLALLVECVKRLYVRRVFEFGSGQSTREFLAAGCQVTVVEDSEAWLAETDAALAPVQRLRFTSHRLPLRRVWLAGAPLQSWVLPETALAALRDAELVLVDSPAWPPFREHALTLALEHSRGALIVVDDANIPTVQRFCRRLAGQNRATHFQTNMDHGLFFLHPAGHGPLDSHRPLIETLKAWRRYFLARGS